MILFITSSYPYAPDGISDGARFLYENIEAKLADDKIILLTTNNDKIKKFLDENNYEKYYLLNDWKFNKKNKKFIIKILNENPEIDVVHIEYPGRYYGKTFLASFLPSIIKKYADKSGRNISVHVRLHEYSKARLLRKIAILPILWKADKIYVPSLHDREMVKKIANKEKVRKTIIGTNIFVDNNFIKEKSDKIVISYFGAVYEGKGIERLFRLWKELSNKYEDKIVFKIIGELNPYNGNKFAEYHKKVFKLIESYGLKNKIIITGYLEEKEVSHEIINTDVAMLLYEDGLTLRRGSFLAFLTHGTPIITVQGDSETCELLKNCSGVIMCSNDDSIIENFDRLIRISPETHKKMVEDNKEYSKKFDWSVIADEFLRSYYEGKM